MPQDRGLDVLAAFADGGIRYINQTGKLAVLETIPAEMERKTRVLFDAAQRVVNRIGPWDQARRPPPRGDTVRMTFVVSDGLCFGEGPVSMMVQETLAGPVTKAATELLQIVVDTSIAARPEDAQP